MKKICKESIELGKRIKGFRLEKGLSIETVSTQVGVAPSTYREWENGRAITGNVYPKIARALGVGVYQVLGVEDQTKDHLITCLNELEKIIQNLKRHI